MDRDRFSQIDLSTIETPCYIVDEVALEKNLKLLKRVGDESGGKILLALKAFAMFSVFPLVKQYLQGICASSPFEARLGREEFGKEVHSYAPAYSENDVRELIRTSDTLIFNSIHQWKRFRSLIPSSMQVGLRINPEYSEIAVDLYNPCAPGSRLGIRSDDLPDELEGIDGLHFHALCEQNSDTLSRTLEHVEKKFARFLPGLKWVNFGGGHHITRPDYDTDLLIRLIRDFRNRYEVDVILEPGEAVALNTGVLAASVMDIVENERKIAILDTSAEAHMPDVLAMPYRPLIIGADAPEKLPFTYRLAGLTCLAGDVIGDYSFLKELEIGSTLLFEDMSHYTMVKNNMFNGVNLPSIAILTKDHNLRITRSFGYEDYRNRLS